MVQNNSQELGKDVSSNPPSSTFFLERIMSNALEEHDKKLRTGDDLESLTESLNKTCTRYKIELSTEKNKLMTNRVKGIKREIKIKGQKLGELQASSTLEQLFQMKAQNWRFSQGLHKPPQL